MVYTATKITRAIAEQMADDYRGGMTRAKLSKKYGVSESTAHEWLVRLRVIRASPEPLTLYQTRALYEYRDDLVRALAELNGYLPPDQQWTAAEIADELVARPEWAKRAA